MSSSPAVSSGPPGPWIRGVSLPWPLWKHCGKFLGVFFPFLGLVLHMQGGSTLFACVGLANAWPCSPEKRDPKFSLFCRFNFGSWTNTVKSKVISWHDFFLSWWVETRCWAPLWYLVRLLCRRNFCTKLLVCAISTQPELQLGDFLMKLRQCSDFDGQALIHQGSHAINRSFAKSSQYIRRQSLCRSLTSLISGFGAHPVGTHV